MQLAALFDPRWRRSFLVATAMVACVMFGVWGFFTWLPSFLATPVEKGGAGLSFFKSVNWTIALQSGAFVGYVSFGWVADFLGRKRAYALYVVMAAVLAPFFVHQATSGASLILIGPLIGLFGHGHFSALAPMLSELFPVQIRATAQSTIYNTGRGISAMAPWLIGAMAERYGFSGPLIAASGFFIASAVLVTLLPRPTSRELPS
ncbi:MAG: MFS transporter, partial [Proteobacteria bacterium]|nr:MFS transporter [Pseudomonadota bacterium]